MSTTPADIGNYLVVSTKKEQKRFDNAKTDSFIQWQQRWEVTKKGLSSTSLSTRRRKTVKFNEVRHGLLPMRAGNIAWHATTKEKALAWSINSIPDLLCCSLIVFAFFTITNRNESFAQNQFIKTDKRREISSATQPEESKQLDPPTIPAIIKDGSGDLLLTKAHQLFRKAQFNKAEALFSKLNQIPEFKDQSSLYLGEIAYIKAEQQLQNKHFATALKHCMQSLNMNPAHKQAMTMRDHLLDMAKRKFIEAYIVEATAPANARQRYLEIIESLEAVRHEPAYNRYLLKAESRLNH